MSGRASRSGPAADHLRVACLAATALAALGAATLLTGCKSILDIEDRFYDPSLEGSCETTFDCQALGPELFCQDGLCSPEVPEHDGCTVLEPEGHDSLSAVEWAADPLVIGMLFREHHDDHLPRNNAMRLAVQEIDDTGVGAGRQLVLVACDYGGPQGNATGAERDRLVHEGVDFLGARLAAPVSVGGTSSAVTKRAILRTLDRQVPMAFISSFSTSTELTDLADRFEPSDPHGLLWRTAPNDGYQAQVLAKIIDEHPAVSQLGIAYINDEYGRALQEGVRTALGERGSNLLTELWPFDADTDFADTASQIQASGADGLLSIVIDGDTVVELYQALADVGGSPPGLFLADAAKEASSLLDGALSSEVRALVERVRGTAPYHSTAPHYDTFATNLSAAHGIEADDYSFIAQSYDAMYVAAYGLVHADASSRPLDGRSVAQGLAQLSAGADTKISPSSWSTALRALTTGADEDRHIDVDGTGGRLDFDPSTGDAPGPIEQWRVAPGLAGFVTCQACEIVDAELACEDVGPGCPN